MFIGAFVSSWLYMCMKYTEIYANWETTTFSLLKKLLLIITINMGPVIQSIFSLTSSLRGQLVKYFTTL